MINLCEQDANLKELVTEKDLERIQRAVVDGVFHITRYLERQEKEKQQSGKQDIATTTTGEVKGEVTAALKEKPKTFIDSIELNKRMTPQEATKILAAFHKTTDEIALDNFINLKRSAVDDQVLFRKGISNSNPCIVMEGHHSNGQWAWNTLINENTGRPIPRTS